MIDQPQHSLATERQPGAAFPFACELPVGPSYSVLIIDDDPVTQLMLRRILTQQGYTVFTADNGADGFAAAEEQHPALIICDWVMPVMDGIEVCRRLKNCPSLCTTFFILLTSRTDLGDRIEGLNAGADEFLAKPIDMNELKARVRAGLRLYQLNQDLQAQKQCLEKELAEAASYVRSLLPASQETPFKIETLFQPSQELGGDCFDYFWLSPHRLVLYLLDVSGHGLGAALPSVSLLNLLRSQSLAEVNYSDPASVLRGLNQAFQMSAQQDKYFTIWYGVYDLPSQTLTFASAGHPPALVFGPKQPMQQLKTPGFPIGWFTDTEYTAQSCQIAYPSTLYLFSDGVYELQQPDGNLWSFVAFQSLLQQQPGLHHQPLTNLRQAIQRSANTQRFLDDFSLLKVYFEMS